MGGAKVGAVGIRGQYSHTSHRMVELSDLAEYERRAGYRTTVNMGAKTISRSNNKSLPKTAINFHKMKKGLYLNQNRKDL